MKYIVQKTETQGLEELSALNKVAEKVSDGIKTELSFPEVWISTTTAAHIYRRYQGHISDLIQLEVLHKSVCCQWSPHLDTDPPCP